MHIYTCTLDLLEHTFFSSREINALFQTEPLISNYGLCYAFGLCAAPYHNDGTIYYKEHLGALNERGIYITPAKIEGKPKFNLTQFNAQTDSYWYKFAQNAIAADKKQRARALNYPQTGKIKMLALGNKATCYLLSEQKIDAEIPPYIRLGKFMSKAKVSVARHTSHPGELRTVYLDMVLNPVDLPENICLNRFDIVNIHPSTFLKHVEATGIFYELTKGLCIPVGMKFGVDHL